MLAASDIFKCTGCGACCTGHGDTFLTLPEARAIARHLSENLENFLERYCTVSGGRLILAQGPGGTCVFRDRQCAIHPVKPRMCRQWPFTAAVLRDPAAWETMAALCPGMARGVPPETVLEITRRELAGL